MRTSYLDAPLEKIERIAVKTDYVEASSSGFLWWLDMILGIQCPFDFTFYPFDKQTCKAKFSSYYYPKEVVQYSAAGLKSSPNQIQHSLKYNVEYVEMTGADLALFNGYYNYSTCGFYINMERKLRPAIINYFLPSSIVVIIAFCR